MEKAELGQSGIMVSRLGLGTVKFGRNEGVKYPEKFEVPDEPHLANILALARESGINLLDTAPAYGLSEERLGRLLQGQRRDWVIVSKAGEEFENGESHFDFSPSHFEMSLGRTLKRLQTDYLDILLIHSDGGDIESLPDEMVLALQDFKKRGLVRAVGASAKTVPGALKALTALDAVMITPGQQEALDLALKLKKGVLLKKIFDSGHREDKKAAIKAAFSHPAATAAIIGTIRPEHLAQNLQAFAQIFPSPSSSSAA